ncbi:hypothetical protein [Leptospira ellinghausenii]|nr:hypothetical protein [Leptospira ellinghausenii]
MIEFINQNSDVISALSSLLLLFVTIIYVVINSLMHSEMVKSRELMLKPDLSLRFERIKSGFMKIVIENNSSNDIYNLTFVEYPEEMTGIVGNPQPGFIKDGIKYMASKQIYESFYINYPYLVTRKLHNKIIKFKMNYSNSSGKIYTKEIEINLSLFYDNTSFEN